VKENAWEVVFDEFTLKGTQPSAHSNAHAKAMKNQLGKYWVAEQTQSVIM